MIDMPKIKAKRRSKKRVSPPKQLKVIVQFDDHFFPQIVHKIRQANFRRDYVVPYGQTKKEDPLKRLKREYDEMLLHSGVDLNDEVTTRLQTSTDEVTKLGETLSDDVVPNLRIAITSVSGMEKAINDDVKEWVTALTDTLNHNHMTSTDDISRLMKKYSEDHAKLAQLIRKDDF